MNNDDPKPPPPVTPGGDPEAPRSLLDDMLADASARTDLANAIEELSAQREIDARSGENAEARESAARAARARAAEQETAALDRLFEAAALPGDPPPSRDR